MSVFIRQLTGIRFVAAFWVFAYHLQGPFNVLGLLSIPVMGDVMRVGRLGVDLFFALSGFILTHTYLTRMGSSIRGSATLRFWWLRLARIYPVHLVMLVIAGLAVFAQARILGEDIDRDWWNPIDFIKNLLLIQEWGPNPERGWNFVAWSLSMEWLAYLVFPVLVLILWRMHKKVPTFVLVIAWFAVLAPLVGYGLGTSDPYYTNNWGSTYRIATEFTAGAIHLPHRPTAVGARTHTHPRRVVVRHPPRAGRRGGGVPRVASGGPTAGERRQPGRRTPAAVFPSRPRAAAGGVDRGLGSCSLRCGAGSIDPHPGARWLRLLLPLHDPPGVDGVMAGGDERRRDRVGRAVCRRGRGADRWCPRHRMADVEGGRRAGPRVDARSRGYAPHSHRGGGRGNHRGCNAGTAFAWCANRSGGDPGDRRALVER